MVGKFSAVVGIEQLRKTAKSGGLSNPPLPFRHLVVIHYHLRPGGVRRIIETALPHIAMARGAKFDAITIAAGQPPEAAWAEKLREALPGKPLHFFSEPAFRYFSEQRAAPATIRARIRSALDRLIPALGETLIWAHNLGLARNLILADELARFAREHGTPLLSHHHDFWFENRWERWPEMRACGFRTLPAVARAVFAAGAVAGHAVINRRDESLLSKRLAAHWLPNPVPRKNPQPQAVTTARRWLHRQLGDDAPVWIFPARFLRRKNFAEAALLTRWLRPEAWFVTTGGVSSPREAGYARRLQDAARAGGWRTRFHIVSGAGPAVCDLTAAAEVVLFTSLQEGFGLPCLEAVAAERPLIARRLTNVWADFAEMGFRFPYSYRDILIDPLLLDIRAEKSRQMALWRSWKTALPASCRSLLAKPIGAAGPLPFSRLTLSAQLEVMAVPAEESWAICEKWNPFLSGWKALAGANRLQPAVWPKRAETFIGANAYGRRFREVSVRSVSEAAAVRTQQDFIAHHLGANDLYPLLME